MKKQSHTNPGINLTNKLGNSLLVADFSNHGNLSFPGRRELSRRLQLQ